MVAGVTTDTGVADVVVGAPEFVIADGNVVDVVIVVGDATEVVVVVASRGAVAPVVDGVIDGDVAVVVVALKVPVAAAVVPLDVVEPATGTSTTAVGGVGGRTISRVPGGVIRPALTAKT